MAGLNLSNGECISILGQKYTCGGKGPGGRYVLVPHKGRVQKYFSAEKLLDLSEQGKIKFHESSDYYGELPNTQVSLSSIPTNQRHAVMMRHFYMIEMDAYRKSGGKLSSKPVASLAMQIHKKYEKHCTARNLVPPEKPLSEATVRRWYRTWQKSGGNVLCLVSTPSGNRHSKLNGDQSDWLEMIIKEHYLTTARRSARGVHELLAAKIDLENRQRSSNGQELILVPSYQTLCRRIRELDEYEVLSARYSQEYAYKLTRHQRMSPTVHKHLEQVQADNTQLDVYVDLGIGILVRPWLTLIIDRYSESILGFWVSPHSASADSVMNALRVSVMPKNIIDMGGRSEWQWPMFGIPEELILDNGKDYLSLDLEEAALELGINLTYSPPRQPYYKSQVEREFGEINKRLLAKLPGQVFKEEPEKRGLDYPHLTFDEFSELLVQWITTVAHKTPTKSGYTPDQLWENSVQKNGFAGSGLDQDFVKLCLSKSSHRQFSIQPDGIHFNSLVFNNEWLSRYRNRIASDYSGSNPKADFKWSASNVGLIWVYDELNHTHFPVEAKEEIARGRSIYNHDVVLREVRNRTKANLAKRSYHDAVLSLDKTITDFVNKNGERNLSKQASRYLMGTPNIEQESVDDNHAEPSSISSTPAIQKRPMSHESFDFDDDIDDDIDDIPDEIEF